MPAHSISGNDFMPYLFNIMGLVGVPIFLMLAGYFEYCSKTSLSKKVNRTLIPLMIWGTLTFLLHIFKTQEEAHLKDYLMWIYGCGSWLYFVPVLLWCQIMLRLLDKDWIWILVGFVSTSLSVFDIIPYNFVFTPYVNPFNFIIYFCAGRLIRKYHFIDFISDKPLVWTAVSILVMTLFLIITEPLYWTPWTWVFSVALFCFLYLLFNKCTPNWLIQIGMMSYVIYLCHMQIAGFIHFSFSFLWGTPLEIVKVFVAFAMVCLFCYFLKFVLKRFGFVKLINLLGFR